jgi:hypothetical protein
MSSPEYPRPVQVNEITIMDAAVKLARLLRKHLIWVVLFPLLGFFGGYLSNLAKGPIYKGEMMLRTRILAARELTFLVSNYKAARYPGLSREESRQIRSLEFETKDGNPYIFGVVECQASDTALFKKLSATLKAHIENEPSVRTTTKNTKDLNAALINEYSATIRKAELLLEQREIDPTLAYKNYRNIPDLTLLYEKRLQLEIVQRDSSAVVIVSDFEPQELALEKAKAIIIGVALGIFAAAALIFIIHFAAHYRKTAETA